MREKLISFLENKELLALLDKHLIQNKDNRLETRFQASVKNLQEPNFIIPVLGTQGSGKSSLLNALLLNDIVLPVDADETTCIPTEIRYGSNTEPAAEIIYKDGKAIKVECSEEGLKPFVHQEYNPGNQMEVEKISLLLNHPLLKSGIVLVDLPGVGSITAANMKTTTDFIKKSTGAIFLLRTVPPITSSEAAFIQGCWPIMANTFFIQNQWTEERPEEVNDGKSHSLRVLKEIAQTCHMPAENIDIDVVGVDQALKAKVRKDQTALEKSGLTHFSKKLEKFADGWQEKITEKIRNNVLDIIGKCKLQIEDRINLQNQSAEQQKIELEKRHQEFNSELENKKMTASQCFKDLDETKKELDQFISETCNFSAENFRNQVREVISNGVTGGEYLNKTFSDYHQEQLELIFQEIQPKIISFTKQISEKIENLGEFNFQNISIDNAKGFDNKTNIHSFYNSVGSVGGSLGGFYAGAAIGSFFPGIGTVIGGIAGSIIGGIFGSFVGDKTKKFHIEKQKEEARTELFSKVDNFRKSTEKAYKEQTATYLALVENAVNNWIDQSEVEFSKTEQLFYKDIEQNEIDKKASIENLLIELDALNKYTIDLKD